MNLLLKYPKTVKESTTIDEIINILLNNRDIQDRKLFLSPIHPRDISVEQVFSHDKKLKNNLKKTCELLELLFNEKKLIIVYTDYDADGITGGAIMWETLYIMGFNVKPYVPDRKNEGYGFSKIGIDYVKKSYDPVLIISVDHGISGAKHITYAKKKGIPVIVTDHHIPSKEHPDDAFAIFHTDSLSGSGVSYFIAREFFHYFKKKKRISTKIIADLEVLFYNDYIGLSSIGSVADLVDTRGLTRSIIFYGLKALEKTKRKGIRELIREADIENKKITTYDIGFIIAPRINAAGRIGHALDALRLLCTTDKERAQSLAAKLGETNRERQGMVEKIKLSIFNEQLSNNSIKIIILHSKTWHEGIIGLIAGKVCEEYYRPCIVMTEVDGFAKGSARSVSGIDITAFLRSLQKYLIDVGGHPAAAGFTIEKKNIKKFIEHAEEKSNEWKDELLERKIYADMKLPLSCVSVKLVNEIQKLAPFGVGNYQPVFYSEGKIINARIFGKEKKHLSITVSSNKNTLEAIFFKQADRYFELCRDMKIGLVYTLDLNHWNGKTETKLFVRQLNILKVNRKP
jgi:single-stranded-DNA-specific exonuclease